METVTYLTTDEAGDLLGTKGKNVASWCRKGLIPDARKHRRLGWQVPRRTVQQLGDSIGEIIRTRSRVSQTHILRALANLPSTAAPLAAKAAKAPAKANGRPSPGNAPSETTAAPAAVLVILGNVDSAKLAEALMEAAVKLEAGRAGGTP